MSKYPQFPMINKSFDYFFNRYFISLDPDKYYIPFSDYGSNRAKISTIMKVSSVNYSTCILFLKV